MIIDYILMKKGEIQMTAADSIREHLKDIEVAIKDAGSREIRAILIQAKSTALLALAHTLK
jgi:hypothetical protein